MKRNKKVSEETDNSRIYKHATRQYKISCPYCKPHRGCNRDRKHWKRRSWKNYRLTQHKEKNL